MKREFQDASFNTITEPRRTEEQLRRDARRDAFRIKLTDTLRALTDPVQIQAEGTRMIGECLRVNHAFYGEIETVEDRDDYVVRQDYHTPDVPSNVGRFHVDDFGECVINELRAGNTFIVSNMATDERFTDEERSAYISVLHIQAWIAAPLIKGGHLVGTFGVQHNTPREWTPDEIGLIEDAAERVWAVVERARAEEALRRSEKRYRTLFENIEEGVAMCELVRDANGNVADYRYLDINPSFEKDTHKTRSEIVGRLRSEMSPMDIDALAHYADAVSSASTIRYEFYAKAVNRWYDVTVVPKSGDRFALLFDNITERKRAQEQIERSNQRLNEILSSIQDDFYVLNYDWFFVYASKLFTSRIGKKPEDIIEKNIWEMFPNHIGSVLEENFRAAMEKREIRRFEIPGKYTNAWYRITAFPCAEGITVLGTEITDRKRAEEALHENQKQLQLLNETLEQKVQEKTAEMRRLASDLTRAEQRERNRISHILHDDLQQRIYSIQMQLSVVRNELQKENESAQREISGLEKQVKEILEIARHLSIDLNPPILRGEGLTHAINWLAAQMKQRYGLSVEIQADESFSIPDEELHILLFNCVRELLFNTVKHAQASRAEVSLKRSDDDILIDVCDDGKGFQMDEVEQSMSREIETDKELQTGFGLSTLRHQLSLYGGRLEIKSAPGEGTNITLIIPAQENVQKT